MRHLRAFLFKFILTLALLYLILGITFGMSLTNVLLITITLNVVEYIVGDLIVLPRTSNTVATIADFGLALIVIWFLVSSLTTFRNPFYVSLVASVVVAMFEYFFHKYVANHVLAAESGPQRQNHIQFQTEASEELHPVPVTESKDKKKEIDRLPRL